MHIVEGARRLKPNAAGLVLVLCLVLFASGTARAGAQASPLEPPDQSSPRATIKTFLESGDRVASFLATEYRSSPSREGFAHLMELAQVPIGCLDLSQTAPVARQKTGAAAALALYEVLSRIELPPLDQMPGKDDIKSLPGTPPHWTIPHTDIMLVQVSSGKDTGDFMFSPSTVENAEDFYVKTEKLPYRRDVRIQRPYLMAVEGGGWLIPYTAVESMPQWLRHVIAGQAVWKWICLLALLALFVLFLKVAYRISRRGDEDHPVVRSIARLTLPVYVLIAVPIYLYLAILHVNARGRVGVVVELICTSLIFLAAAWLVWRLMDVVAEAMISSPQIKPRSIDAHLTRVFARIMGFAGAVALLVFGADEVGIPVYGVIAGLGVGGLAIALSAQPTLENLIGGLNIFADRPIRVGHLCKYGTDIGTVEEIGIRSTRIRGADQTITTVPNGLLSKMSIVNMTAREQMLIRTVVTLPGDARERIRYVLSGVEQMLRSHTKVDAASARVRLTNYTGNSAEIELFAYALTAETESFLMVQQDVLLKVMDIVDESKAATAKAPATAAAVKV